VWAVLLVYSCIARKGQYRKYIKYKYDYKIANTFIPNIVYGASIYTSLDHVAISFLVEDHAKITSERSPQIN
jgi:hypothetical protein